MSDTLDEYIDEVNEKISKIPNFDKESIESLLEQLPNLEELEVRHLIKDINSIVDPAYQEHKIRSKNPVLSFPGEDESKGDVEIGHTYAGDHELYSFSLTTENLRENIFSTARAGHGKTTLVFHVIDNLVKKKINFVIPDWKNDYRVLAQKYPDISVLKWSDLKFNPLTNCPDGMKLSDWHRVVFTIFCHSFGLFSATESYILQSIEDLRQDKEAVTFKDLEEYMKMQSEQSRKRGEYHDVAENRIFSLNHSLDKVINVKYGWEVKGLFQKQVIVEMSPLDFPTASFLIQCTIMHEFYRRLRNNVRMNRKSTLDRHFIDNFALIIMDEAHLTQYAGQEDSLVSTEFSAPPMTTFFSQSRELLMSTFALTQFPHLVMKSFKDNAGTKIIGNIIETNHQRDLASSIGLDRDDEKILGKLDKGYWITRVSGRTKPFLLRTPEIEKGNLIAEEEMLARSKPIIDYFTKKEREHEARFFLNEVDRKKSDKVYLPDLPEEAWSVIDYIFNNPFDYQDKIKEGTKLTSHKMDDMKKLLKSKDLVQFARFPVYTPNVRLHYILTPNALKMLQTLGKSQKQIDFHRHLNSKQTRYMHRYFQHLFAQLHRKLDWTATLEKDIPNGRRVDIFLKSKEDGKRKVIEIETSTNDLLNKVRVVTDDYADELVLLYKDVQGAKLARSKLEKAKGIPGDKIYIGLLRDYVVLISQIIKGRENAEIAGKQADAERDTDKNGKPSGKKKGG